MTFFLMIFIDAEDRTLFEVRPVLLDGIASSHCRSQSQPPVKKLHLLINPPIGGVEAHLTQGLADVFRCPIDCRRHSAPYDNHDDGSLFLIASYMELVG